MITSIPTRNEVKQILQRNEDRIIATTDEVKELLSTATPESPVDITTKRTLGFSFIAPRSTTVTRDAAVQTDIR